ncbi:MAG: hypothetical protein AMXMBFR13_34570 [Phycisphaerae bacterium]
MLGMAGIDNMYLTLVIGPKPREHVKRYFPTKQLGRIANDMERAARELIARTKLGRVLHVARSGSEQFGTATIKLRIAPSSCRDLPLSVVESLGSAFSESTGGGPVVLKRSSADYHQSVESSCGRFWAYLSRGRAHRRHEAKVHA